MTAAMNGIPAATSSTFRFVIKPLDPFWTANVVVWLGYVLALMVPWFGTYPVLMMLPNKLAIAGTGMAMTAALRTVRLRRRPSRVPLPVVAVATCMVAAVLLDVIVVVMTQGPSAILMRWEGSVRVLEGGIPLPGRIGQYATIFAAWTLAFRLFDGSNAAASAPHQAAAAQSGHGTLVVSGSTVRARDGARVVLLERDEIEWIAADGDYVRIHASSRTFLIRSTMKQTTRVLAPLGFARIHRSAIVNPRHVREIVRDGRGEFIVLLRGGARVRASQTYASQVDALTRTTD
ncbi:MAG TPA: LytTR family DNA-binding domain-containing protein [Gemmatimonadaceae bacterium]